MVIDREHCRETINRQRRIVKRFHEPSEQKRERCVFGKVRMSADRLAERRDAGVAKIPQHSIGLVRASFDV